MIIICWDYDGTLVSSENIYKNVFVKYLTENNLIVNNIDDQCYFSRYGGRHPFTIFNQLKSDGYIYKNAELNKTKFFLAMQKELNTTNNLLPTDQIDKVLEDVSKRKDVVMAIVTSTYRNDLEAKHDNKSVSALKKYFTVENNIYICGEIGNKELKPSPNGYIFAYNDIIKKNNILNTKNTLIMVEDSVSGCKSGRSAKHLLQDEVNSIVIGYMVANKYSKREELLEAGADITISTPQEMINFIKSIN